MSIELMVKICKELEVDNDFDSFLEKLHEILDHSDPIQVSMFKAIKQADIIGDSVNNWFFSNSPNYQKPVIWLAKITNSQPHRFVWAVGFISPVTSQVRHFFSPISSIKNNLISINRRPPFLFYFNSIETSKWQLGKSTKKIKSVRDFDVFQVNQSKNETTLDVDYEMLMNANFIKDQSTKLLKRVHKICTKELISFFDANVVPSLELLCTLDIELHNYGHFLGYLPFAENKNIPAYETVEEYRAYLVGGYLGLHLLPYELQVPLLVVIILTRILIYGFEFYLHPEKTHEDIREISVAAFFYFFFNKKGSLHIRNNQFDIDLHQIELDFCLLAEEIQSFEKDISFLPIEEIQNHLQNYSIEIFNQVYPEKQFPEKLSQIYASLT